MNNRKFKYKLARMAFGILVFLSLAYKAYAYSPVTGTTFYCYPTGKFKPKSEMEKRFFTEEDGILKIRLRSSWIRRKLIPNLFEKIKLACKHFSENEEELISIISKGKFGGIGVYPRDKSIKIYNRPSVEKAKDFKYCYDIKENLHGKFVTYTIKRRGHCTIKGGGAPPWAFIDNTKYLELLANNLKGDVLFKEFNTAKALSAGDAIKVTKIGENPYGDQTSYTALRECMEYYSIEKHGYLFWNQYRRVYCTGTRGSLNEKVNEEKFSDYLWKNYKHLYFYNLIKRKLIEG